jgi:hypothetical protein
MEMECKEQDEKIQELLQALVMELVEMNYKEQVKVKGLMMRMEFRTSHQITSLGPVFGRIPHVCFAHQEQ